MKHRHLLTISLSLMMGASVYAKQPLQAPQQAINNNTQLEHGIHKKKQRSVNAPMPEKQFTEIQELQGVQNVQAVACNVNAFATSNTNTLINEIKTQGSTCVNELFGASSSTQIHAFSSDNMYSVANHTASISRSYAGSGDPDLEALYLFLRAGYYAEFYNNSITFVSWVKPAVKSAIDAFVNNANFYNNNDNHGKVLQEVIIAMDSTEQQDIYMYVVSEWLNRWNQSYGTSWNMRSAVNGIFTILFRGQWNNNFKTAIGNDTTLVSRLRAFTMQSWMVNSDAEYMISNAAKELGRLKMYTGTGIQSSVDAGLNSIFSTYQMYGYGDAVWLGAADTADYYGNCADYGICGYGAQIESQALSQTYVCSSTIKIRSQNMTATQHASACATMGAEEVYFHSKLQTGNTPIPGDTNTQLQVNIFDKDTDYQKYAAAIFGINTNNGGMYLEGNPADPNNMPNFVAYEASYAEPDHYVWNLEHEYVHYLDGRFNLAGDFNAPTAKVVWWAEGLGEYIANQDNNQNAYDTIHDGSTYNLSTIFATTYDGFDVDRIYRWGYLAVRFMFERHANEVQAMRNETRAGNWSAYQSRVNTWANNYSSEFTSWLSTVTPPTPPGNNNPIPNANGPYSGTPNSAVSFSSAGSTDSDGTITSYYWDFGDGTTSAQANPNHTYTNTGNYVATLTVTDDKNATASATANVSITTDPNPTPGLEISNGGSKTGLTASQGQTSQSYFITVPANASNLVIAISGGTGDADLYVNHNSAPTTSTYSCRPYQSGNNETCTVANPAAGKWYMNIQAYSTFSGVTLTASYEGGQTTPNDPPRVNINGPYSGTTTRAVAFSSAGSSDTDGSISSYAWDFGDGNSSTSANPNHTYQAAGNYTVSLTLTDNLGASASASSTVNISDNTNPNTSPTAVTDGPYTSAVGQTISMSSNGSIDPDGNIVSYSWNFGDGSQSTQANPSHAYNAAGTFIITLTVTDDKGATGQTSTSADISGGGSNVIEANANGPYTGTVDNPINFSSVGSSSPDGPIVEVEWDFGDGNGSSTNNNPSYSYATEGEYTVTLLVIDEVGNEAEATATVTITGSGGTNPPVTNVPDMCAVQGPQVSGELYDGTAICLGSTSENWFNIADVNGFNSIAISTAHGTGDLNIDFSNMGWPNSSNTQGSSHTSGNGECIYLTNMSEYWGYIKVSGSSNGASLVVDFDTAGCR